MAVKQQGKSIVEDLNYRHAVVVEVEIYRIISKKKNKQTCNYLCNHQYKSFIRNIQQQTIHVKKNKSILHSQVQWLVKHSLLLKVMIQERGNSIMGGNDKGKKNCDENIGRSSGMNCKHCGRHN